MAIPVTIKSAAVVIKLGDGGAPEVFTAPCGLREKSISISKQLAEDIITDCIDTDAPSWTVTDVESLSWSISGQGLLAVESVAVWDAYMLSTVSKNIRVEITYPSPVGLVVWAGAAHLESFELGVTNGRRVTCSINLRGDGELTRTPSI